MLPAISQRSAGAERHLVSFASDLERFGDRLAVVHRGTELTYTELAARVHGAAERLGAQRRLVLLPAANDLEPLVLYLAALQAGHPVLVAPGDSPTKAAELAAAYDPDVVIGREGDRWSIEERRDQSAHELHPELALLLSTSGTTGSSKLVRLSQKNLSANAESIAEYLDITDADRAPTTLPLHYCYGLSVVHSYLQRGAGLILTDLSVVDRCFWTAFRSHGATSLAGVPYTFDLLDRVGFEQMSLPSLRYVTQAGGRLAPDRVRRYAELGRRDGWQFFVMYGQTEATARMAYLPPERAASDAHTIGIPIPGGSFDIVPVLEATDPAEGELVYRGPNVMLGYAERADDLALGRTTDELRTGDLARRTDDGLYQVVGRRSRFLKLFGLRVDLDQVERIFADEGLHALCTGDDERLVVALEGDDDSYGSMARSLHTRLGLPASSVVVRAYDVLPRLANGKPDYVAIRARAGESTTDDDRPPGTSDEPATVSQLYSQVLHCGPVSDDATFVSLGGDSLSYVELSVKLEQLLGHLPTDWHVTPIGELAPHAAPPRLFKNVETNVVLRAVAIALIVGTHVHMWDVQGGAHVLLAIAGFNFARFQLAREQPTNPAPRIFASALRVAIPSMLWIGICAALSAEYGLHNAVLLNNQLGSTVWDERWRYWYLEAFVQIALVLALVFAIPAVRRAERRSGYAVALGAFAIGFAPHVGLFDLRGMSHVVYQPHTVFWVFALGWLVQRSSSGLQRVAVSGLVLLTVPGRFESGSREALISVGLMLLIWLPTIRVPWPANRVAGTLAAASFYIYLTHPQVYPPVRDHLTSNVLAFAVSLAVGVLVTAVAQRATSRVEWWLRGRFATARVRRWTGLPRLLFSKAANLTDNGQLRRQTDFR